MKNPEHYNSEGYLDMTAYLATRDMMHRRTPADPNWVYRRGDIYLANLNPSVGSEQGGTRPVVVLQNNSGNYFCSTIIVAPITSRSDKRPDLPIHYYANSVHGLNGPAIVLLEQIRTIDKTRVHKYLGRMTRYQMNEISEMLETSLGLYVPEDTEAP